MSKRKSAKEGDLSVNGTLRVGHPTIELDPFHYRWLKIRRGETDQTIKAMVNQAIKEYIEREEEKKVGAAANGTA